MALWVLYFPEKRGVGDLQTDPFPRSTTDTRTPGTGADIIRYKSETHRRRDKRRGQTSFKMRGKG